MIIILIIQTWWGVLGFQRHVALDAGDVLVCALNAHPDILGRVSDHSCVSIERFGLGGSLLCDTVLVVPHDDRNFAGGIVRHLDFSSCVVVASISNIPSVVVRFIGRWARIEPTKGARTTRDHLHFRISAKPNNGQNATWSICRNRVLSSPYD